MLSIKRPRTKLKRRLTKNQGVVKINIRTENLTILFVDIAGFTAATSRQSRRENAQFLHTFNSTLLPLITAYRGTVVKSIGDALLLTFRSPTDAMLCAMALQDAMHAHNLNATAETAIHIRVAAHLGEVRITKKDIFGEPVNVASRIEGITPSEEIYLSEAVYMAMNKAEVPAKEVGFKQLKGVAQAIRVYNIPRFSTHRLVPDMAAASEEGSELLYPYGGMHYRAKPSGLSALLQLPSAKKNAVVVPLALVGALALGGVGSYVYFAAPKAAEPLVAIDPSPAPGTDSVAANARPRPDLRITAAPGPVASSPAAPVAVKKPQPVAAAVHPAPKPKPGAFGPIEHQPAEHQPKAKRDSVVIVEETITPPPRKPTRKSSGQAKPRAENLVAAKEAYESKRVSKEEYKKIVHDLKVNYKAEITRLKSDYKAGKMSKEEYAAAVRKAKLELKNGG